MSLASATFPLPLESYAATTGGVFDTLAARAQAEPLNLVATGIFLLAILHTFLAGKFRHWSHLVEERHRARLKAEGWTDQSHADEDGDTAAHEVSFAGQMLHFLSEIEAVFGLWAVVLAGAIIWAKGWGAVTDYIGRGVNFTEPMFVVIIMALASTRPVLRLAEQGLRVVAALGRGTVLAWWLAILVVAPVLGSFITEPAAMTIAASLLARQFYAYRPTARLAYATLGLLFVNISVGGTLTHFAAPPVLMVAAPWGWGTPHMIAHFGWKALVGIVVATGLWTVVFRREFAALETARQLAAGSAGETGERRPVPGWITAVHLGFMGFTVLAAHHPPLFVGGFLFYLAFAQATAHHQEKLDLRPALLVGFFLAGLVVHGGLQGWWIEPVLGGLGEVPLFLGATVLTAFNDNAAITYLATLVPGLTDGLKHAVVAGAVAGGGLTVIANAPNPAGQAILGQFFPGGVSPLRLLLGALVPTVIVGACFLLL
jgi:hypothetical protein